MSDSRLRVALLYFSGLILFDFWFDCINRAPALLLENVPYIKKVVFPLEILCWVALAGALFRVVVSGAILLAFYLAIDGVPPASALAVPVTLVPFALVALGFMWFLSAAGVYLRDLRQAVVVVAPTAMFLSPIFFPLAVVPEPFQTLLYLNPLTLIVETVRAALFLGQWPDWTALAAYSGVAWFFAWAGYAWFLRLRGGFADVV
jgi:lipopolysaccharide transport system permease protein